MTTSPSTNRRELEAAVSAVASSVDGRHFTFQCSIHDLALKTGGYASIDGRLGQVHAIEAAWVEGPELVASVTEKVADASHLRIALARGHGVVLDSDGQPFHESPIVRAETESVAEWLDRTRPRRASLDIGELILRPGVRFGLDAGGFDRHTFFCGQSGSGKTYALGTILEQLLLETSLRLVILDPNSDFVRLGEIRERRRGRGRPLSGCGRRRRRAHDRQRARSAPRPLPGLRSSGAGGGHSSRPDPEPREYGALVDILEGGLQSPFTTAGELAERLAAADAPELRALATRMRNLGLHRWPIWSVGTTDRSRIS